MHWTSVPDALPNLPGAYALWIGIDKAVPLPPRFAGELPVGAYCYVGSARGPGGIRARCGRHLRRPRRFHWHVDWLTEHASILDAMAFPDARECDLLSRLLGIAGCRVPVPGFGSSDCRRCPAHLIAVSPSLSQQGVATALTMETQA